jgi:hypothetical protein
MALVVMKGSGKVTSMSSLQAVALQRSQLPYDGERTKALSEDNNRERKNRGFRVTTAHWRLRRKVMALMVRCRVTGMAAAGRGSGPRR